MLKITTAAVANNTPEIAPSPIPAEKAMALLGKMNTWLETPAVLTVAALATVMPVASEPSAVLDAKKGIFIKITLQSVGVLAS